MSLSAKPQIFSSTGVPAIVPSGKLLHLLFTITASGNYVTGGDTLDLTQLFSQILGYVIPTGELPLQVYIQSQSASAGHSGYQYYWRPGTTLQNGRVQVLTVGGTAGSAMTELAAGAYPAAITGDTIVAEAFFPIE